MAYRTVEKLETDLVLWMDLLSAEVLVDSWVLKLAAKTEIQMEYL